MGAWRHLSEMKYSFQLFWEAMYGGGLLSLIFAGLSSVNWIRVVRGWCGQKSGSLVPLFGGLVGCAAVLLSGVSEAKKLWWVPFVLDPGSLLMVLDGVYYAIKRHAPPK